MLLLNRTHLDRHQMPSLLLLAYISVASLTNGYSCATNHTLSTGTRMYQ